MTIELAMPLFLDALVRSTALLLVGLAAVFLLRRRSAALRHWLLAATIGAAALATPLAWVLPDWPAATVRTSALRVFDAGSRAEPASSSPIGAGSVSLAEPVAAAPDAPRRPIPVGWIWALGCALGVGSLLLQMLRLAAVSARARPVTDGRWLRAVDDVARRYGIRQPVPVLQTRSGDLLATCGLFRPRILVPPGATRWSEDRILVVVSHELAHVRRRDWALQIAADVLRRIYWFQPLMWVACRQLRRESEHACDDAVLDTGVAPETYAGHLLQLARAGQSNYKWAPAVPMARPSTLERRIAAMLNRARNRRALTYRSLLASSVVVAAATLGAAAFHAEQQPGAGQLLGTIYDNSGAVLPGVSVTLIGSQDAKAVATTDQAGRFGFPGIAPGKYKLEAALPGFGAFRQDFELKNSADWDRVITLQLGQLSETISVMAKREPATQPAPGGPPAPRPIRVGGNIKVPTKLVNVNPTYPASMRAAGRSGVVSLDAVIGADGSVIFVRVLSANVHPDFATAAVDAVRQWKFSPTLLNGKPVDVAMAVSISFDLE